MLNKTELNKLVEHLTNLGTSSCDPINPALGLCREIKTKFINAIDLKELIDFAKWEYFSGYYNFPIPAPNQGNPKNIYHNKTNIWDDSEYGNLRREFCLWCADQIKIQINTIDNEIEIETATEVLKKVKEHFIGATKVVPTVSSKSEFQTARDYLNHLIALRDSVYDAQDCLDLLADET